MKKPIVEDEEGWEEFNEEVKNVMGGYAKKKGWKLVKNSEPIFRKGVGEVYMHTGDAVIFGTIKDKLDNKKGKYFAKNYPQDDNLFFGHYSDSAVKRYIQQGRATLNQIDRQLGLKNKIRKKTKKYSDWEKWAINLGSKNKK